MRWHSPTGSGLSDPVENPLNDGERIGGGAVKLVGIPAECGERGEGGFWGVKGQF